MIVNCLTVPRNTDRQARILQNWQGFDVTFYNGLDIQDINCPGFEHGFAIICCWAGHIKIWQNLANKPGWHLIIEDDSKPLPTIHKAIEAVKEQEDFDIVKLRHDSRRPVLPGIRKLLRKEWESSSCYMIRNTEKFLPRVFPVSPDRLLNMISPVAGVFPPATTFGHHPSTIPAKSLSCM